MGGWFPHVGGARLTEEGVGGGGGRGGGGRGVGGGVGGGGETEALVPKEEDVAGLDGWVGGWVE